MFDGIMFDLDGTLWDATQTITESWNQALVRHPEIKRAPVTNAETSGCMGLLRKDIALRLFPEESEENRRVLCEEQGEIMHGMLDHIGGILYPAVEEILAVLSQRAKLFLVSNCGEGYLRCFYHVHGLKRYFAGSECAGRTGLPKRDNIALVVRQYGLERPVYVGDTQLDCDSAKGAGVPFLYAAYGFGTVDADVPSATSFRNIPDALERMSPP